LFDLFLNGLGNGGRKEGKRWREGGGESKRGKNERGERKGGKKKARRKVSYSNKKKERKEIQKKWRWVFKTLGGKGWVYPLGYEKGSPG